MQGEDGRKCRRYRKGGEVWMGGGRREGEGRIENEDGKGKRKGEGYTHTDTCVQYIHSFTIFVWQPLLQRFHAALKIVLQLCSLRCSSCCSL